MGTVGINFGSASSGQGFDVAATVTQILANEQQIESPWKTQLTALKAQDAVFTTIGTDLSTLSTKLQALTDFNGVLSQKQGSSSNTNLLTLTGAGPSAVAGSHTIIVSALAQTSSNYSDTIANASDLLSGSLTIQVGSAGAKTITAGSSDTLFSFAAAINAAGLGVSATVISDAAGARLSLVSGTSGAGGNLTVTSGLSDATTNTNLGFSLGQSGLNGIVSVDGVKLQPTSNTLTGAIPGVTFQLLAADQNTSLQVQITNDNGAVTSAVNDLINAYNAVAKDAHTQDGKDASGRAEPLSGSPTLSLIQNQLSTALLGGGPSGSINNLGQLGISLQQDGTLVLDTNALQTSLNNNYSDVTGFLQNANSFGAGLSSALNLLGTQAPNGSIYLSLQQNSAEEQALNQSVTLEDARIAEHKLTLTAQLNQANQILQSIPAQLNQQSELYSAITGYNPTSGG